MKTRAFAVALVLGALVPLCAGAQDHLASFDGRVMRPPAGYAPTLPHTLLIFSTPDQQGLRFEYELLCPNPGSPYFAGASCDFKPGEPVHVVAKVISARVTINGRSQYYSWLIPVSIKSYRHAD